MVATQSANGFHSVNVHAAPAVSPNSAAGLVPTIQRFIEIDTERKALEKAGRELAKQAETLEKAIADAVEVSGGMLEAGPYVLGFEWVKGSPAYKGICEAIVKDHQLPANTLPDHLAAVAQRRKLVIA